jgi:putative oxidoreductase
MKPRVLAVVSWTLRVLLAAVFAFAAYRKFTGHPIPVATFEGLGLGQWFRFVTGALELAGAVGLLIPATHLWAAAGLSLVMVGAAATHLFFVGGSAVLAFVLLGALVAVLAIGIRGDSQAAGALRASDRH